MQNAENTTTFKPFDELVCSDNFMFAKVMEDPKLCKQVLETLLDIKIEKLSYPEGEKTILVAPDAKAVRRCTSSFKFTRSGNLAVSLDKPQNVDKTQSETRTPPIHTAISTLKFKQRSTKNFVSVAVIIKI